MAQNTNKHTHTYIAKIVLLNRLGLTFLAIIIIVTITTVISINFISLYSIIPLSLFSSRNGLMAA